MWLWLGAEGGALGGGQAGRRCLEYLPREYPGVDSAREGGAGGATSLPLWPRARSTRSPGDTWPRPGVVLPVPKSALRMGTCLVAHTWRGWRAGSGMYL